MSTDKAVDTGEQIAQEVPGIEVHRGSVDVVTPDEFFRFNRPTVVLLYMIRRNTDNCQLKYYREEGRAATVDQRGEYKMCCRLYQERDDDSGLTDEFSVHLYFSEDVNTEAAIQTVARFMLETLDSLSLSPTIMDRDHAFCNGLKKTSIASIRDKGKFPPPPPSPPASAPRTKRHGQGDGGRNYYYSTRVYQDERHAERARPRRYPEAAPPNITDTAAFPSLGEAVSHRRASPPVMEKTSERDGPDAHDPYQGRPDDRRRRRHTRRRQDDDAIALAPPCYGPDDVQHQHAQQPSLPPQQVMYPGYGPRHGLLPMNTLVHQPAQCDACMMGFFADKQLGNVPCPHLPQLWVSSMYPNGCIVSSGYPMMSWPQVDTTAQYGEGAMPVADVPGPSSSPVSSAVRVAEDGFM